MQVHNSLTKKFQKKVSNKSVPKFTVKDPELIYKQKISKVNISSEVPKSNVPNETTLTKGEKRPKLNILKLIRNSQKYKGPE